MWLSFGIGFVCGVIFMIGLAVVILFMALPIKKKHQTDTNSIDLRI